MFAMLDDASLVGLGKASPGLWWARPAGVCNQNCCHGLMHGPLFFNFRIIIVVMGGVI